MLYTNMSSPCALATAPPFLRLILCPLFSHIPPLQAFNQRVQSFQCNVPSSGLCNSRPLLILMSLAFTVQLPQIPIVILSVWATVENNPGGQHFAKQCLLFSSGEGEPKSEGDQTLLLYGEGRLEKGKSYLFIPDESFMGMRLGLFLGKLICPVMHN